MRKLIFAFILLLFPVVAFADELKLVKGKGVPVCEAHLKNLKSMDFQDMICHREKYPENREIKRPKWEQLDLRENKELLKKTLKFLSHGGDQFAKDIDLDDEKTFEKNLKEFWVESKEYPAMYILYTAKVDINNDGKPEKILLYGKGICMLTRVFSRPLLVLTEDRTKIDVEKTRSLLQNIRQSDPLSSDIKAQTTENLYRLYDVFFYKHSTYFDKWNEYDLTLSVYRLSKDKTKEVCKYKYIFNKPLIKKDY
jgi:hypothetical protein